VLPVRVRWSEGRPPAGPAPLALLLHGWGGDEHAMDVFGAAFGPGWLLASPRAPFPVPTGGYAWYPLGPNGQPDLQALGHSLAGLISLLDQWAHNPALDPRRRLAVGFSQGGAMAAALALRAPERLAGVAIFSGFLPPGLGDDPPRPLTGLWAFIAHGLQDPMVPGEAARALADRFRRAGAEVTLVEYAGGHKMEAPAWRAFRAWLATFVPPSAPR